MYPWVHIGPYALSTYSLLFLCAFIVGGLITYREAKRLNRRTEAILRVALGALGGGLIGAKASMPIFLGPQTFIHDLPVLWYSGQTWTGAFFGGYLGVLLIKRLNHIRYSTGDVFALALPISQAIGRFGNVLGGDPFGKPSNLPWALMQDGVLRQPSALYEMFLLILLFLLILYARQRMPQSGDLFKLYVISYCCLRFLVDFTRADPQVLLGLTLVQVLYIPTILGFGYSLYRSYSLQRQLNAPRTAPEERATRPI
jgi:phosphatidylglycerol---prolipoprotein diacylglyceryl transferase